MAERKYQQGLSVVGVKLVKEKTLFRNQPVTSAEVAIQLLRQSFSNLDRECLGVINVDVKGNVTNLNIASTGTVSSTLFSPREIFKSAILSNSSAIILLHNHPSGDIHPSREDYAVTHRMLECCKIMDIRFLDHIIFGAATDEYYSFSQNDELRSPNDSIYLD